MDWQQQQLDKARGKLMSEAEREAFIRDHGEVMRPMLERLLDEKAAKIVEGYEKSWASALGNGEPDPSECRLMTAQEAATLVAMPLSTIKRLKALGLDHEIGQRLLSHEQAATFLGCSVASIKRMVRDGRLPDPVQIGERRIGHRLTELEAFIAQSDK